MSDMCRNCRTFGHAARDCRGPVSVQISPELHQRLTLVAVRTGVPIETLVERALERVGVA